MNEEAILRRLRRRDPAALEALMDCYIPYLSAIVWNILRASMTREDAEEVVSDVFLAAWDHAGDIRPGSAKAWLGAVARNKARNKLRQAGKDLPLEEDVLEMPGDSGPADAAERAEEQSLVRQAVEELGEPDREIFLRHYYFAQTVPEIGSHMGMKESTIKTRLRRGREKLKSMLERSGVR